MKWVEALKFYNQGKSSWCVARKGTPEYDEVKKIMMRDKPEAVAKRNEERGEKVKEQLKEIASASSKRREEARKKYAEKLAEMEHHKKKEEQASQRLTTYKKFHDDPFFFKMLGQPSYHYWEEVEDAIKKISNNTARPIQEGDYSSPVEFGKKKVYEVIWILKGVREKKVPPKTSKLIDGYTLHLVSRDDEDEGRVKTLVAVKND